MEKKQISVHRNTKDLIRDKMGIQKLKKKTFKQNVLLRINIYCWAPKWYSFGKSIARPKRGGAEFQDGLKSHPVIVKKPFQDVPGSFHQLKGAQTQQMWSPPCSVTLSGCFVQGPVVPPPPAWGPEELPVVVSLSSQELLTWLSSSPSICPWAGW